MKNCIAYRWRPALGRPGLLLVAGILAVSALAGCKSAPDKPSESYYVGEMTPKGGPPGTGGGGTGGGTTQGGGQ